MPLSSFRLQGEYISIASAWTAVESVKVIKPCKPRFLLSALFCIFCCVFLHLKDCRAVSNEIPRKDVRFLGKRLKFNALLSFISAFPLLPDFFLLELF
jgi:hypothetical protein